MGRLSLQPRLPPLSVVVCAHNEEGNIERLLEVLGASSPETACQIVVVSSSTDNTDAVVRRAAERDPRVVLIVEPERRGKIAALNGALPLLESDLVCVADADCIPAPGALESIRRRFEDERIGGVGTRNTPVNAHVSLSARVGAVLWQLHDLVSRRRPMLGGDVVAFRRLPRPLPDSQVNDDFTTEALLIDEGFAIVYEPGAVTRMLVPATWRELLLQRRRIRFGYRRAKSFTQRRKSTQEAVLLAAAVLELARREPRTVPLLLLLGATELLAYCLAAWDAFRGDARHFAWQAVPSTKGDVEKATMTSAPRPPGVG